MVTTKEENEKMLEAIEDDPTWKETIEKLAPMFYNLAMHAMITEIMVKTLNEDKKNKK